MKRLFTIVFLVIPIFSFAQMDTIVHVIERGESIELLAERYGVTEEDIKKNNGGDFGLFYTGMELRIPVPKREVGVAASSSFSYETSFSSKCKQADAMLSSGDYKKAIKAYSQLIDNYSTSLTCTEAYYGRALAYYNRGKWKDAIKDFETVIDDTDFSESARSQCEELLSEAQKNRQAQLEERGQMWTALIGAAAMTTATVISASQQAKASNKKTISRTQGSSYSTGSYSEDEDETSVSSSSKKKSSCSGPRKYNCGNTGICAMCGGDGFMGGQFGEGANSHKCTLCGGSGNCKYCN